MNTRCGRLRTGAVVVLVALALTNCSSSDPQARLDTAIEATLDDAFAFTVSVTDDDAGVPPGVEVAGLLAGAALRGTRGADGAMGVAYEIGASAPLFEVRTHPDHGPLLRMGMADLLGGSEADPEEVVGPLLDERGVTGEQRAALLAGFVGDWIELEDVQSLGALAPGGAPADAGDEDAEAPLESDWREAILVTDVTGEDGATTTYTVRVDVETLRQALSLHLGSPLLGPRVPADAPGTVTVVDGRVHRFVIDLGVEDPSAGARLEIDVTGHGTAALPPSPDPVAQVSGADLAALVEILQPAP